MYIVHLAACGNPDHGELFDLLPGVPVLDVEVASVADASQACRAYIRRHDLGGGNWFGGEVYEGGTLVARVSYNGRVWCPNGSLIREAA